MVNFYDNYVDGKYDIDAGWAIKPKKPALSPFSTPDRIREYADEMEEYFKEHEAYEQNRLSYNQAVVRANESLKADILVAFPELLTCQYEALNDFLGEYSSNTEEKILLLDQLNDIFGT